MNVVSTRESQPLTGASQIARRGWAHPERYWLGACLLPALVAPLWIRFTATLAVPELQGVAGLVLCLLMGVCAATDLAFRRIPNWATYPALLWALALNACHSFQFWTSQDPTIDVVLSVAPPVGASSWLLGTVGLGPSLLGSVTCFAVMYVPYKLSRSGAGDLKLAAAMGALLGFRHGLLALAMTYLTAGITVLLFVTWTTGPLRMLQALLRWCAAAVLLQSVDPPTGEQQRLLNQSIPMGPFFAAGSLIVLFRLLERLEAAALAGGLT